MNDLYARAVFFVENVERALRFYAQQLGFAEHWSHREQGRLHVCQVSLFGFELILNEAAADTRERVGHGRVFIGLADDQIEPLHQHIARKGIHAERRDWGRSTLVIRDPDGNELFFWDSPSSAHESRPSTSRPTP